MSIDVRLLQPVPAVFVAGRKVALKSQKAEALLLYVLLSGQDRFRRDVLASLFWEDHEHSRARDNFRQTLTRIKKFGSDLSEVFQVGRSHIDVDQSKVRTDVGTVCNNLRATPPVVDGASSQFNTDDLFRDYFGISTAFDSWLRSMRTNIEAELVESAGLLIRDANVNEDAGLAAADWLLKIDATNEEAVRFRMRVLAGRGQQGEALKTFNRLNQLLDESYDVEPTPETLDLNASIKLGKVPKKVSTPSIHMESVDSPPPTIYVSPIEVDGLSEYGARLGRFFRAEVLTNLSRFREWSVIDAPTAEAEFYKLDCELVDFEDEISARMTLQKLPDHQIIWSDYLTLEFDSWKTTQWRIAQQFAMAVNQSVTSDTLRTCLREKPENRTVFEKWVLSVTHTTEWTPSSSQDAINVLTEITAASPHFAPAHAVLAGMYNKRHLVFPGLFRESETEEAALRHAEAAMRLDPMDSNSHRVLAWSRALKGDYDAAEFHFGQACSLNPTALNIRMSCALGFAFMDDIDRATELVDTTLAKNAPLHPFQWGYIQNIYFLAERWTDACNAGRTAGKAISNLPAWQAAILVNMERPDEAGEELELFFSLTRNDWHGPSEPDETAMMSWLFHCFPLRSDAKMAQLRDSVELAHKHYSH